MLVRRQRIVGFLYPVKTRHGLFTIAIKVLVFRLALTDTHHLDVGNHEFYLVVSDFGNLLQLLRSLCIVHFGNVHKSHIVQSLRLSVAIMKRNIKGTLRIDDDTVKVAEMKAVCTLIPTVGLAIILRRQTRDHRVQTQHQHNDIKPY